jgi:hypothetical protein
MRKWIAVLVLSGAAVAEICPASIQKIQPEGSYWDQVKESGTNHPTESARESEKHYPFRVKVKNTAGREISSLRLKAEYLDGGGDAHPIARDFSFSEIQAGQDKDEKWIRDWPFGDAVSYRVWVDKVKFKDGTEWQDAGLHTCSREEKAR